MEATLWNWDGDEVDQDLELQQLICEGVLDSDPNIRAEVFHFLQENENSINIVKSEKCLTESISKFGNSLTGVINYLLDRSQFFNTDKASRIEILDKCIREGEIVLWRGSKFQRYQCMGFGAWEGDPWLFGVIKEYYDRLPEQLRELCNLEKMKVVHEYSRGYENEKKALSAAIRRLAETDVALVCDRIRNDGGFLDFVETLIGSACKRREDLRCRTLEKMYRRLEEHATQRGAGERSEHEQPGGECALRDLEKAFRATIGGYANTTLE
jgi:hypothetical protein